MIVPRFEEPAERGRESSPHGLRGAFITLEGGEGVGKSTQVGRLVETLRLRSERPVTVTREPGGSARAEVIRAALLGGAAKPYGPFAEALLFCAARIDHLDRLIRPALERGESVICDRFIDSTRAYQGAAGGLDPGLIAALERVVVGPTRPDLTLILDLGPEDGLARARTRGAGADRFEAEPSAFHARLREAFLTIAAAEPLRCVVIDAGPDPDEVEATIRATVSERLPGLLTLAGSRDDAA